MTNKEAIAFFKDMNECTYGNLEAVEMAIKALEQQPCEDCISRKETLNKINEFVVEYMPIMPPAWTFPLNIARAINELPSVTPKGRK